VALDVKSCGEDHVFIEQIVKWLERPPKSTSVSEITELSASLGTTIGEVRTENQDRAVIARFTSTQRPAESFLCFALCDGMGGMVDGAQCAELAMSSFLFHLTDNLTRGASEAIRAAAMAANSDVYRRYQERGGTTLVAIVVFPESSAAVSVGDSRIYAVNPRKEVRQVSVDDTIASELSKIPGLEPSALASDTHASQLTQFVGIGSGMEPRMYSVNRDLVYLLTSDGIHRMSGSTLAQIAVSAVTPQLVVPRLLHVSRWCGGTDNASVICVPLINSNWLKPPRWSGGEWLEIWDAFGKLELPLNERSHERFRQVGQAPHIASIQPKPSLSRKRAQGTSKRKGGKTSVPDEQSSPQGSLKIEIEGNADGAGVASVHTAETPEKENLATQDLPKDKQGQRD
jgi:PPM family protein phosphatase